MLSKEQAIDLVREYMDNEEPVRSTQEILDSGVVPRLKGFTVKPGKVSDSIFGGHGSYINKTTYRRVEFDNPVLRTEDGIPLRIMVRTEQISTHDISRGSIPFKDQVLALNHNYMRKLLAPAIGTSQFEVEGLADNSVIIAAEDLCQISFENVLRAFMAKSSTETSLYRHYIKGEREFCGHKLPDNLISNGPLPYIMDTPSTKSAEHDESVSPEQLFKKEICTPQEYSQIRNSSIFGFGIGSQFLQSKGIILVDTKFEHGINHNGEIVAQDEILTMDSSRFWLLGDYKNQMEKLESGRIEELKPTSYSKEFARGFSKGEQGYTDTERALIAVRYIIGIQRLLGKPFEPDMRLREKRVVSGLETIVDKLVA